MITIHIDASTHPKKQISAGALICKNNQTVTTVTLRLDEKTNHEAEFSMLIYALNYCFEHNFNQDLVFIYSDSKLVVDSYHKKFVKNELYKSQLNDILKLTDNFPLLSIEWIPEHKNKMADHYARRELAKHLSKIKK